MFTLKVSKSGIDPTKAGIQTNHQVGMQAANQNWN